MKKLALLSIAFVLLCSHDMFLKMNSFFLQSGSPATLLLYNGTFDKSDNVIARDRMLDVSLYGNDRRHTVDTAMWTEEGSTTVLKFQTGDPGTWVAGVSTRARSIELASAEFNDYLDHDGVVDMLDRRKADGTMDQDAVEKYSKHVKAVFQVGDQRSNDWETPLGYPIEFVPQTNPYDLAIGDELRVKLLRNGLPLPEQLVYSGFAGSHSHSNAKENGASEQEEHHHDEVEMRTDANGAVDIKIDHGGQWYVRTIHMVTTDEPGFTHESNWATLTFEVAGDGHGHSARTYIGYWIGGALLLLGLFFFLRKRVG